MTYQTANHSTTSGLATLPVRPPKRLILCTKCEGSGICRRLQPECQTAPPPAGASAAQVPQEKQEEAPIICTRDSFLSKPQFDESWKTRMLTAAERRRSEVILTQVILFGALAVLAAICVVGLYRSPGIVFLPPQSEQLAAAKILPGGAGIPAPARQSYSDTVPAYAGGASANPSPMPSGAKAARNQTSAQQASETKAAVAPPEAGSGGDTLISLVGSRPSAPPSPGSQPPTTSTVPVVDDTEKGRETEITELLEPTAAWWQRWDLSNLELHAKAEMHDRFDNNKFVLETYPPSADQALVISARVLVPDNRPFLEFAVRAQNGGEFNLIAEADGRRLLAQAIRGPVWQAFALDLTPLKRKDILVTLKHAPSIWEKATAYWQAPMFVTRPAFGDTVVPFETPPTAGKAENQAAESDLLGKMGFKAKPKPVKFADVKLEYERTIAEVYALLESQGRGAATTRLEQAQADPQLAPVRKKLARDVDALRYLADVAEAGLTGALRLANCPEFNLRWNDGQQLRVGTATSNAFTSVDNGDLEITQTLPQGQAVQKVPFNKLAPQVRYELAVMGLPATPEAHLKLAAAGITLWHSGTADISPKEIRASLALAAKSPALAEAAAHLTATLEFLERELAADARFHQIQKTLEQKNWPELRALIDSFKADYLNTYAMARLEKDLDECIAQIPRPTLGKP